MINKNVSIVIPTYNRSEYLKTAIDSCLNQTVSCEVIVVDHGSTDNTPDVAAGYGDLIKYVRRELDSGVHFSWLDGILHAKHELIHLNFDDDWIEPSFIEKCLEQFSDDVGMVLSDANIYFEDTDSYNKNIFHLHSKSGIYKVDALISFNLKSLTSPCSGIFRKKILIDSLFVGKVPFTKYDYRGVGPDILFSLFSCNSYKYYGYVAEPLVVFRAHNGSITIESNTDIEKTNNIARAYDEARIYYFIDKIVNKLSLYFVASKLLKFKKKYDSFSRRNNIQK